VKVNVPVEPEPTIAVAIARVPAVDDNTGTDGAVDPASALFPNGSVNCSVTVLAVPICTVLGLAVRVKSVAAPANVTVVVATIPPPFSVTVTRPTVVVDVSVTPAVTPVVDATESVVADVPVTVKVPRVVVMVTGIAVAGTTVLLYASFKVKARLVVETPFAAITLGVAVPNRLVAVPPLIVIVVVVTEMLFDVAVTFRVPD
jgi:hypothetical protein